MDSDDELVGLSKTKGEGNLDRSLCGRRILRFLVSPCPISLVWVPYALCIGGIILSLSLFYPGVMPISTYTQFYQMEIGKIGDAHPPILAASFWYCKWVDHCLTGEQSRGQGTLYVLWTLTLWSGILLILCPKARFWQNTEKFQKPWWIVLMALFLLLWSLLDPYDEPRNIMKDSGMLAAYLFAAGCLMNFPTKGSLRWCVALIVLFFLFYGTALRHNAIFAAIPLLFWLTWHLIPQKKIAVIIPCTLMLWLSMLATIQFVNYDIIGAIRLFTLQERFYADIFHLNARTNRFVVPPNTFGNDFSELDEKTFRELFDSSKLYVEAAMEHLKRKFPEKDWWFGPDVIIIRANSEDGAVEELPAFQGNKKFPHRVLNEEFVLTQYPKDYSILRKAWIDRIVQDPVAYIKFKTVFFIKYCRACSLVFLGLNPLFLLPILSLIAIVPVCTRNFLNEPTFPGVLLAWSALLYLLPLWMFLPDGTFGGGFRYLFWFFAASIISIVYFCSQSPLFLKIIQTVHQHLENKAKE